MNDRELLLVTSETSDPWVESLKRFLDSRSLELLIVGAEEALSLRLSESAKVILIDSTTLTTAAAVVASLRAQSRTVTIIVIAAAPDFEPAREVLRAGANDYLYKTSDLARFLDELGINLKQPLI
jgi:DNA-binding response OmpR family regulator